MKQIKTKKAYKLLAWVVLLAMIIGIVPTLNDSHAAEPGYKETIIMSDTFDSGTSWNTTNYHWRLNNSQYAGVRTSEGKAPLGWNTTAARQLYKGNGDSDNSMTDVYIKSDVCVTSSTGVNSTNHQYHFIFARGTASAGSALGFGLKTTRNATASSLIVAKFDNNPSTTYYESEAIYDLNTEYTLELYVIGNLVIAKCDDVVVFREEVTGISDKGYCGLRDRLATKQIASSLNNSSVYGTDYEKRGYFDNFSIGTVEEAVADGFEVNGPVIVGTDGKGVADLTFYSGGTVSKVVDDASVTVEAMKNKKANYYESEEGYDVTVVEGGEPMTAKSNRVFVVDDLSKTVTQMSDSRWTGNTKDDAPNFTVDSEGKAILENEKYSVLSMGENDDAYTDFYVEYKLTASDIPADGRTVMSSRYNIAGRKDSATSWSADILYDLRSGKDLFSGRLYKRSSANAQVGSTYASGTSEKDVAVGTEMTIAMLVCNGQITYTVNGDTVASDTVTEKGWFALLNDQTNATNMKIKVEHFVFIPLTKSTVDVTFEASDAIMQGDAWNVTATPTYSWPYGIGTAVSTGVTIENFDNNQLGPQTAKLTFDGISKNMDVMVVEKPDGFKLAGPAVVNPDGSGVADIILMSGVNEIERIEDASVTVAGFSNATVGLYEDNREVFYTHTAVTTEPWKANIARTFVVADVKDAVTNMKDTRWTGVNATDAPNFTVDADGKALLTNNKFSVLSMGEADAAYTDFYVEYQLTISDIPAEGRNIYSSRFNLAGRTTYSTSYSADALYDLRSGRDAFTGRVYKRGSSNAQVGATYASGTSEQDVALGSKMTMGILVHDGKMTYTINGNVVASTEVTEKGWFTLYNEHVNAPSMKATVENFIYIPMDGITQQLIDVEFDYPKAVLPNQTPEIKATPIYNWPYGKGEAVTEGVILSGLDTTTLGKKEFTASYQGVDKQLEVEVSNILFKELFDGTNADLTANGWGKVTDKSVTLQDETLHLAGNSAQEGLYLTELSGSNEWTDYTVQAEVSFDKYKDLEKTITATLAARTSGMSNGYEWSLCVDKTGTSYVRLYDRTEKKQLMKVDYPIDPLEVYTMKLTVVGNTIKGYINGEKIIETTATTCERGSIGVRCWANGVTYDNVIVSLPEEDAPVIDVTTQQVWFTDTFESESAMSDRGWNLDSQIKNGASILDKTQESVFLNQIKGCENWTDYTAEADVTVVDSDELSSVGTNVGALVFRSTSAKTGYEFGVTINSSTGKGGFRLYNRTTKEQMFSSSEVETIRGETYRLRAVAEGNHILCFVDDQLIFEFVDDTNSKGYIGLRSAGFSDAFDNVVVRKIVDADRQGKLQTGGSQTGGSQTGDSQMPMYIPILFMALAAVTVVVVLRRRKYQDNNNI